ncbi:MAG TPA: BrnT family toxin [Candidatus Brocadiales bacterium]|nr:BrnT family toxin [Candidatus Brocadiales bacterium]
MKEITFDWDQWNIQKNETKHGISSLEAESSFYDNNLVIFKDIKHSTNEDRLIAYGKSAYNNIIMIAFTIRNEKIRIISARKASRKEKDIYEEKKK